MKPDSYLILRTCYTFFGMIMLLWLWYKKRDRLSFKTQHIEISER